MGNFWKESGFSRDQVLHDVNCCNKITENHLFYKRTNLKLIFLLVDDSAYNRKTKKIIEVKISNYVEKTKEIKPRKEKNILINDFYKFYNCLMNCLPMFYDERLKEKIRRKSLPKNNDDEDEEDSTLCPICEEFQMSVQLSCGHFFCKQCIQTWVNKSSKTCPMCRLSIEVDKNKNIKNMAEWDIVDDKKINKNEMESEYQETFYKIIGDLFQ